MVRSEDELVAHPDAVEGDEKVRFIFTGYDTNKMEGINHWRGGEVSSDPVCHKIAEDIGGFKFRLHPFVSGIRPEGYASSCEYSKSVMP